MNKKTISVDKVYKLKRDISPLSLTIPSRNTKRFPLLHFDGQYNRPLRYAVNQKSPFEDEQDDNAILEPVIFVEWVSYLYPKTEPCITGVPSLPPSEWDGVCGG